MVLDAYLIRDMTHRPDGCARCRRGRHAWRTFCVGSERHSRGSTELLQITISDLVDRRNRCTIMLSTMLVYTQ